MVYEAAGCEELTDAEALALYGDVIERFLRLIGADVDELCPLLEHATRVDQGRRTHARRQIPQEPDREPRGG